MQAANELQNWIARMDRRIYAIIIGLIIGVTGGLIGLMLAIAGPVITIGVLIGIGAGLYILTNVTLALYGMIFILILLPFGTFPVKIAITPTLLDIAILAFITVYLFLWMTGQRQRFKFAPPHLLIALYVMWLIFTFMLGLRYAMPSSAIIRQFAETLLSIGLVFIIGDLLRNREMLRRLVLVITVAIGIQALMAITLYALPDSLADSLLIRLGRLGYPDAGVIRYIEDNPELGERAIGTWVDPNTLGGVLAVAAAVIMPQLFTDKPALRHRWLTLLILAAVGVALFLSSSRASFLAFGVGMVVISVMRYRRFLPVLLIAGILFFMLPQTQLYTDRLIQAFTATDLATQMRIGEWTDSIRLIQRYPIFGVGFTGTPDNTVYTDVANMYLIMANQIGLTGVLLFLITMSSVFLYGWRTRKYVSRDPQQDAIHLGYHIALLVALINAGADLYFFRLDFQSSITWFWLIVALAITSSRLALETAPESGVAKE